MEKSRCHKSFVGLFRHPHDPIGMGMVVTCDSWCCPCCRVIVRYEWEKHLLTCFERATARGDTLYVWHGLDTTWQNSCRQKVKDQHGTAVRIVTGTDTVTVIATALLPGSKPLSGVNDARAALKDAFRKIPPDISRYTGKRAITTMQGWGKAPRPEKPDEEKWILFGGTKKSRPLVIETLRASGLTYQNNWYSPMESFHWTMPLEWTEQERNIFYSRLARADRSNRVSPLYPTAPTSTTVQEPTPYTTSEQQRDEPRGASESTLLDVPTAVPDRDFETPRMMQDRWEADADYWRRLMRP